MDAEEKIKEEEMMAVEDFGDSRLAKIRLKQIIGICLTFIVCRSVLWDFLEKPWTSKAAKIFAFSSLSILFISTVTFIVSTVEEFSLDSTKDNSSVSDLVTVCAHVDTFTFIFFTVEYLARN